MAKGNLAACLAITLPHEGGWSDHPKDPGGATMKGITLATFRRFVPGASKTDLRAISNVDVEHIYRVGFWDTIKGDQLPAGPDASVFDYGVNSGPSRSIKDLQRVLGVDADGELGAKTLGKLRAADGKRVIQGHCARRLSFMRSLKIWDTFKRGWSRRVADVEAKSVALWLRVNQGMHYDLVAENLEIEADKADAKATTQNAQAATTTGGGVTAGGADSYVSGDINWLVIAGLAVAVVVVVTLLIVHSRKNRERASAYRNAALLT